MELDQIWTDITHRAFSNAVYYDAKSLYEFFRNIKITLAYFGGLNSFVDEWILKASATKNFLNTIENKFSSLD